MIAVVVYTGAAGDEPAATLEVIVTQIRRRLDQTDMRVHAL